MKNKRNFVVLGILASVLVVGLLAVPAETKAQTLSVDEINNQINTLLKQLVVLLTTQLQDFQQQLAAKLGQQPATTTPSPAAAATTTAETAATSTVAENKPPRVNIVYPYGGLNLTTSDSVDVTASAFDEDGSVSQVEFFTGETSIGVMKGSIGPWSVRWASSVAGNHTLTAKATDDKGAVTTSGSVELTVKSASQAQSESAGGFQDIPPVITIATTITGTALTATATVTTYAGSITNVVWSRAASTTSDGAYVTDATSPYNGAAALAIGVHTISAIATNSQGTTARTASTTVTTN